MVSDVNSFGKKSERSKVGSGAMPLPSPFFSHGFYREKNTLSQAIIDNKLALQVYDTLNLLLNEQRALCSQLQQRIEVIENNPIKKSITPELQAAIQMAIDGWRMGCDQFADKYGKDGVRVWGNRLIEAWEHYE